MNEPGYLIVPYRRETKEDGRFYITGPGDTISRMNTHGNGNTSRRIIRPRLTRTAFGVEEFRQKRPIQHSEGCQRTYIGDAAGLNMDSACAPHTREMQLS